MTDLVAVMSRLVSPQGEILIPGVLDKVRSVSGTSLFDILAEEMKTYNNLDFNMKDFKETFGNDSAIWDNEKDTLMHRWRYPSLSLHGIEGAFYSSGCKTVIPAKVIGKFSIRTVPDMDLPELNALVCRNVKQEFSKLNSKNTLQVECIHDGKYWLSDINHWNFVAGAQAVEKVFGCRPDYTREGGSIPITLIFEQCLKRNVLLLPMGACDDGAHSINEKLDKRNYIQGIKLYGAYLHSLSLQKQ